LCRRFDGDFHTCAHVDLTLAADSLPPATDATVYDRVYCWGDNSLRQLGNTRVPFAAESGTDAANHPRACENCNNPSPIVVLHPSPVHSDLGKIWKLAAAGDQTCARIAYALGSPSEQAGKADEVLCWGDGQLPHLDAMMTNSKVVRDTLEDGPIRLGDSNELLLHASSLDADIELEAPGATTPFYDRGYYRTAPDLYGYHPRFQPGVTSFHPQTNLPYVRAGTLLQWLTDEGHWEQIDLHQAFLDHEQLRVVGDGEPPICAATDLDSYFNHSQQSHDERVVFFRNPEGSFDAVTLIPSAFWRCNGGQFDRGNFNLATLYHYDASEDQWRFQLVNGGFSDATTSYRIDGKLEHRDDLRVHEEPPAILLQRGAGVLDPANVRLVLPSLDEDGHLDLSHSTEVDPAATAFNQQIGGMNITYTADHPTAGRVTYVPVVGQEEAADQTESGSPIYLRVYEHETQTWLKRYVDGDTVKLDSEPPSLDAEEAWVAISPDTNPDPHHAAGMGMGIDNHLWLVVAGRSHKHQFLRSSAPSDAALWAEPETIGDDDDDDPCFADCGLYTYPSVTMAEDGTLHLLSLWKGSVNDDRSGFVYNNQHYQLVYHRREPSGQWTPRSRLIVPSDTAYHRTYKKFSIDKLGRLFFYAGAWEGDFEWDERVNWRADLAVPEFSPECESNIRLSQATAGTSCARTAGNPIWAHSVLISENGGDSFRLATTADFSAGLMP
jgi:hypothetical protein